MASESLVCVHAEWQPGDGGELRVFPYPRPVEVIAPVEGRLVLFEPRMVHDVLPNYKKRFCFTLWCGVKGAASSHQIDHETLSRMELDPSLASAAAIAEAWRRREQRPLVYDDACHALALFARDAHVPRSHGPWRPGASSRHSVAP